MNLAEMYLRFSYRRVLPGTGPLLIFHCAEIVERTASDSDLRRFSDRRGVNGADRKSTIRLITDIGLVRVLTQISARDSEREMRPNWRGRCAKLGEALAIGINR